METTTLRRPAAATALFVIFIIESVIWAMLLLISIFDLPDTIYWALLTMTILGLHIFAAIGIMRKTAYAKYLAWFLTLLYLLAAAALAVIVLIALNTVPSDSNEYEGLGLALMIVFGSIAAVAAILPGVLNMALLLVKSTRQWLK